MVTIQLSIGGNILHQTQKLIALSLAESSFSPQLIRILKQMPLASQIQRLDIATIQHRCHMVKHHRLGLTAWLGHSGLKVMMIVAIPWLSQTLLVVASPVPLVTFL